MAIPTVDGVREAIRNTVVEPEIGLNIVDLGLIYDIKVTGAVADILMTLTSPAGPGDPQLIEDVKRHVHQAFPGLDEVNINITWSPFWNPGMMSDNAREQLGFF